MNKSLAKKGMGEDRELAGFTIIMGNPETLLKMGSLKVKSFDYRKNLTMTVDDVRELANGAGADGAIVIDLDSGDYVGAGYFVGDISNGDDSGGARHQSASAIAEKAGCFVIKASHDHCSILKRKIEGAQLQVFDKSTRPVDVPVHEAEAASEPRPSAESAPEAGGLSKGRAAEPHNTLCSHNTCAALHSAQSVLLAG